MSSPIESMATKVHTFKRKGCDEKKNRPGQQFYEYFYLHMKKKHFNRNQGHLIKQVFITLKLNSSNMTWSYNLPYLRGKYSCLMLSKYLSLVSITRQMPRPRHKNKAIIRLTSHPLR